jgi:hypothetical protein
VIQPSCNTCRFWTAKTLEKSSYGVCRLNAPVAVPIPTGLTAITMWPATHGDGDWCAQHQVKTENGAS